MRGVIASSEGDPGMALFSLRNVSLAFGGPRLLDQVSLQIERGERLCLMGRNGEGKSTLLKLIRGEIEPDEGEFIRQQGLVVSLLASGGTPRAIRSRLPIKWRKDCAIKDMMCSRRTIGCMLSYLG